MGALTLSKSLPRFFRSGIKEPLDDTRKVVGSSRNQTSI